MPPNSATPPHTLAADAVEPSDVEGSGSGSARSKGKQQSKDLTRGARILRPTVPILLMASWEYFARTRESLLFPTFTDVVGALWQLFVSGEIFGVLWRSNQSLLIGTTAALLVAIPVGILLGRSRLANRLFGIYIEIDLASPTIAFLPIVIVVFGLGLTARSVVVFMFSFALTASLVRTGARTVDPSVMQMAEAFAPTRAQLWKKIIIPGILPALGGAFRIAISRGVVGMIIVELTLVTVGIGGLIMNARSTFQADVVYAGVIIVCAEGLLLMALGRRVERIIAPQGLYGKS